MDNAAYHKIILVDVLLSVVVFALVGYGVFNSYQSVQQEMQEKSRTTALLASEQISRTFQATENLLDTIGREILLFDGLARTGPDSRVSELMRRRLKSIPYIRALFVIGANGRIIHDSDLDTPDVSLADRGYFVQHRDDPDLGFSIGKPLVSRSVYQWFISATKRIPSADGAFQGIVVAAIEPRYLEKTYAALSIEDFRSVNLWMNDNTLMMRYPRLESAIAENFPDRPEVALIGQSQTSATLLDAADIDGGSNIISYAKIPEFPLYLSVVIDPQNQLSRWRQSITSLALTGIIALCLIILSIYLLRQLQRYLVALASSEAMFRSTFEQAAVGMARVAPDGRWLEVNDRLCEILEYDRQALLSTNSQNQLDPDRSTMDSPEITQIAAGAIGTAAMRKPHMRKDGSQVWLSLTVSASHNPDQSVSWYIWIVQDITDQKRAEQALGDSFAEMEERVRQRTADLQVANAKLIELDHLKSLFIASMSHELRTPLNSVIGFTGMLLQEIPGAINDKQRDYLTRVAGSGRLLLSLITDVIDIAKLEAGKAQVYAESFDLSEAAEEAVEHVRLQAEKKGLDLQLTCPQGITIYSDRRKVIQCLMNYLSNAIKYTERGGINVQIEPSPDQLISVSDTGNGIAPEDQPRLFKQFSRIDCEITRTTPGSGLGLYLTNKLVVELLGGQTSYSSRVGKGSVFRLHLPERTA